VELTPDVDNPVFTGGDSGAWDSATVFGGRVVVQGGRRHLFYIGSSDMGLQSTRPGYASSPDGAHFSAGVALPFSTDAPEALTQLRIGAVAPLWDGAQWVVYYSAGSGPGPGQNIGRATATAPEGPWTHLPGPALIIGEEGAWDSGYVVPESVVETDDGYALYYTGGASWPEGAASIGLATSPDGITWTKHAEPVLKADIGDAWDAAGVWGCSVQRADWGWEMFYTGSDNQRVQIGYATSPDGVRWTRYAGNPVLRPGDDPALTGNDLPILQSPSVVADGATITVYYDYGASAAALGRAQGTVSGRP